MRVAVVGAGGMGGLHADLLGAMAEVEALFVVDPDLARAAAVAERSGASVIGFADALRMADAIVVATPPALHADAVRAAVDAGRHVLCEKPLTEDLASSRELVRLAEERSAHLEVGFQRRHDPGFAEMRRRVAGGTIGRVHLLRLTASDPRLDERPATSWPMTEAAPMFLHSSIHDFDFARWVTGSEVVEVTAIGSHRDGTGPEDPRGIETAVVTMRLASGTLATLEGTWLHPGGYDIRAELVADGAHLSAGLGPRTPVELLDWTDAGSADGWPGYVERFTPAYRAEHESLLAAARGDRPPASTARDGLEALRIAVAATRSFVERRTVAIAEV